MGRNGCNASYIIYEVALFSVAVAVEKQRRFFVDNLMFGVQLADVLTRCSSHPQGKSEAMCENDGNLA